MNICSNELILPRNHLDYLTSQIKHFRTLFLSSRMGRPRRVTKGVKGDGGPSRAPQLKTTKASTTEKRKASQRALSASAVLVREDPLSEEVPDDGLIKAGTNAGPKAAMHISVEHWFVRSMCSYRSCYILLCNSSEEYLDVLVKLTNALVFCS